MTKYDLILFDADGTIFDYDKAEGIALRKTFEHYIPSLATYIAKTSDSKDYRFHS